MEKKNNQIIVGVTGHRHLFTEDIEDLTQTIRYFFLENFSTEDSVFVLSGLAEGADQLAAETVLALKENDRPNLHLIGFLPMPIRFYEEDFAETSYEPNAPSPREKFYRLLSRTESSIELPLISPNDKAALTQHSIDRIVQYDLLGSQLVRQSSIILALWDGETRGIKAGGTADVVRRALLGPNFSRVFHIVTPQNKKGRKRPENALKTQWLSQWPE